MRGRICKTCKAWDPEKEEEGMGLCRAHAPTVTDEYPGGIWPTTYGNEWCLEWKHSPAVRLAENKPKPIEEE